MSSVATPLLAQTIEPDDPSESTQSLPTGRIGESVGTPREPIVLTPTNTASRTNATPGDAEAGLAGILKQSSHPAVLAFLYFFRIAAVATYLLCGFLTENYILSTVAVVVLLAMDFWNCRNVAGRRLVGLRYWNQVDDDGESYWVFESRDPSRPANPIDAKFIAIYSFPVFWFLVLILSLIRFSMSFVPIVVLALVFNCTNAVGFTYA
ncbi:uncharacterized protein EI90DRAFT_3066358 [Cantharellus anzutake]|uniref:uncharacterized protein n=1 Tax=Cantharellus anzutake TaxID=1750568 RepID=UPI001904552F|nr:uncharacterized protein EI90DRAFT_3066358 [Cantharellus anzutake]KAF8327929.1 hypothetical protein EI90DRAFT_3066358 [Cantharellus anzutake]